MTDTEELADAKKQLDYYRRQAPEIQKGDLAGLEKSFKIFLDSNPDEVTFSRQIDGCIFTHRMFFYWIEQYGGRKRTPAVQVLETLQPSQAQGKGKRGKQ